MNNDNCAVLSSHGCACFSIEFSLASTSTTLSNFDATVICFQTRLHKHGVVIISSAILVPHSNSGARSSDAVVILNYGLGSCSCRVVDMLVSGDGACVGDARRRLVMYWQRNICHASSCSALLDRRRTLA